METNLPIVRLTCPEDVLAYLPYRFGFVPSASLAVLALVEPVPGRVQIGMAARLDLADLVHPEVLEGVAAALCAQLDIDAAVSAFTVVYTDTPLEEVRTGCGVAARVLQRWLDTFPYADRSMALVVTPEVFGCLECAEQPCCPSSGHPVERLRDTAVAAAMVLAGEALAPSRDALACPRDVVPERRAAATKAADRERQAMRTRPADRQARWRRRMLDSYGAALARAGAPGGSWTLDPGLLGRLGVALDDPHLRDAVVAWTLGGERVAPGPPEVLDVFTAMTLGGLEPPSREHLGAAAVVLTEVARHAAPGRAGYALAVLAWVAWWRGDGARADVLVEQSLGENRGCTLAWLLRDTLDAGVRPGWALPAATLAPGLR